VEYQLLCIAQEAMNNVVKHAGARRLEVQLDQTSGQIVMSIKDDGVGFDAQRPRFGHFGMIGMAERAREIRANLSIDSKLGHGTVLSVVLPLKRPERLEEVDAPGKMEHLIG
jgi:signal transduction histidine kinase